MKKLVTNWIFIFVLSAILLFGLFFYALISLESNTPSAGWSKAMSLSVLNRSQDLDPNWVKSTAIPMPDKNAVAVFWQTNSVMNYRVLDSEGNIKKQGTIDYKFPDSYGLQASYDKSINLYSLSSGNLYRYNVDPDNISINSSILTAKNVKTFCIYDKSLLYSTDTNTSFVYSNKKPITVGGPSDIVDYFKGNNNLIYILTVQSNPDSNMNYSVYNPSSGDLKKYIGISKPIFAANDFAGASIAYADNKIIILYSIRTWETGVSSSYCVSFPLGHPESAKYYDIIPRYEVELLKNIKHEPHSPEAIISHINSDPTMVFNQQFASDYDPQPMTIKDTHGNVQFLFKIKEHIGYNTQASNLRIFNIKNGMPVKGIALTRMNGSSSNPVYFSLGNNKYLLWENLNGDTKEICLASTNKAFISKTSHLSSGELKDIYLKTVFGIATGIAFIPLIFVAIIIPVLFVFLIFALISLKRVESDNKTVMNGSYFLHALFKIVFIFFIQNGIMQITPYMPAFMQSMPAIICMSVLTTAIAALCHRQKYADTILSKSLIGQYGMFLAVDLVLFSMIFCPYFSF